MFKYERVTRRQKDAKENYWYSKEIMTSEDTIDFKDLNDLLLGSNERMIKYLEEIQKNM